MDWAPKAGIVRPLTKPSARLRLRVFDSCPMLLLTVSAIKLVAEIALMALAGQFVLGLLAGRRRDSNFFYRLLQVVTNPFVRGVRWIAPRAVLDRHLPLASFVLLASVWLAMTMVKIDLCLRIGVAQCR